MHKVCASGRGFATGDRVHFLRDERGLGLKKGTLGTVSVLAGPLGWTTGGWLRREGLWEQMAAASITQV